MYLERAVGLPTSILKPYRITIRTQYLQESAAPYGWERLVCLLVVVVDRQTHAVGVNGKKRSVAVMEVGTRDPVSRLILCDSVRCACRAQEGIVLQAQSKGIATKHAVNVSASLPGRYNGISRLLYEDLRSRMEEAIVPCGDEGGLTQKGQRQSRPEGEQRRHGGESGWERKMLRPTRERNDSQEQDLQGRGSTKGMFGLRIAGWFGSTPIAIPDVHGTDAYASRKGGFIPSACESMSILWSLNMHVLAHRDMRSTFYGQLANHRLRVSRQLVMTREAFNSGPVCRCASRSSVGRDAKRRRKLEQIVNSFPIVYIAPGIQSAAKRPKLSHKYQVSLS